MSVVTGGVPQVFDGDVSNESYEKIEENPYKLVGNNPLSTFSIDVDRASYSNVRRYINNGQMPPIDAVRIEELINYFEYEYPEPTKEHPVAVTHEITQCPWNNDNYLLRVALAGEKIADDNLPASNLVFLLDVSGSMNYATKLPLDKKSLLMLLNQLREKDRVAIVVYAGSAGVVLPSTSAKNKQKIIKAINNLRAGGSTAGGAGINLAYKIAKENFITDGNNRVILATDGDFNVGVNSEGGLERLIEEKRKEGVFLTCLGFGMGNYKGSKIEVLANKGNGNYGYIDTEEEANKMLVKEFGGTLHTIAKDVKAQIEFNPRKVQAYRLLGYENRLLNAEDFLDDTKDAGEMGSGHTVTALYEIVPVGIENNHIKKVPELKYSKDKNIKSKETKEEMATIKIRYKEPKGSKSNELSHIINNSVAIFEQASNDHIFISAVTLWGMILRQSKYAEKKEMKDVSAMLKKAQTNVGYRSEFVKLVNKSAKLKSN